MLPKAEASATIKISVLSRRVRREISPGIITPQLLRSTPQHVRIYIYETQVIKDEAAAPRDCGSSLAKIEVIKCVSADGFRFHLSGAAVAVAYISHLSLSTGAFYRLRNFSRCPASQCWWRWRREILLDRETCRVAGQEDM